MINIRVIHREEHDSKVDIDELVNRLVYIGIKYYHDDELMASHMKNILKPYIK